MNLQGMATIVTGASQGLGKALAGELARAGARVVCVARDAPELERAVDDIRRRGGTAHALAADMGDKLAIHPLAGAAAALVGEVDLLIHAASTLGPTPLRLLLDTDCEELERVLAVNLVGPFRLGKIVGASMALRGRGTIVSVSSDAAVEPYPSWGAYGVSKAALDHLTRIWAEELRSSGVRLLSVDPGEMDTRMHAAALPDADPSTLARPEAVAACIVRLLRAELPTGTRVDGATLARDFGEPLPPASPSADRRDPVAATAALGVAS